MLVMRCRYDRFRGSGLSDAHDAKSGKAVLNAFRCDQNITTQMDCFVFIMSSVLLVR